MDIRYNELYTFDEVFTTDTEFQTFITENTIDIVKFDLVKLYEQMNFMYKLDGIKHTTKTDFKNDFIVIWNKNIYKWNRKFELLSQDYDFIKQVKKDITKTDVDDELISESVTRDINDYTDELILDSASGNSKSYEKPQFSDNNNTPSEVNDVLNDGSRNRDTTKVIDDDSVRSYDRDNTKTVNETVTISDLTSNEQIEKYFELYERFNLTDLCTEFESLFVDIYIIA